VTSAPLQAEELLAELVAHDVEFVVIGGFALSAHGYVRGTKDVDIVPKPSKANLGRLADALRSLEAAVDIGDPSPSELGIELDLAGLSHGGNLCLATRFGRLDVMQDVRGIRDYARLRDGAVSVAMHRVRQPVLFAGYEELVAMKAAAGRDQDLIDIAELRRARGAD
jgi:hypothetical protein